VVPSQSEVKEIAVENSEKPEATLGSRNKKERMGKRRAQRFCKGKHRGVMHLAGRAFLLGAEETSKDRGKDKKQKQERQPVQSDFLRGCLSV